MVWDVSVFWHLLPRSDFRGVMSQTRGDGRRGFIDEYVHSDENTRSLIRICRRVHGRVLAGGGGSKLDFGDKNSKNNLWLK
jgi:hypothetical protein